jgi:hypothetical protein
MQTIAVAPAVPAALLPAALILEQTGQTQTPAPKPPGQPAGQTIAKGKRDMVGEPMARWFTPAQFAALSHLSNVLVPPMNGNPGALEARVPEFLDFLLGQSPADRQQLYRSGLDLLNARATKQFGKPFASLDSKQSDFVIRPLMELIPWEFELPRDPAAHFFAAAHNDIRAATRNSWEWSTAAVAAGRRPTGAQLYFLPVDPIYKG